MLLETFPRGQRHFMVCYPFEGRLAHTTLAMLLTRRLERLGAGPLGFVCNDYALAVWALKPLDGLDFGDLFDEDMLGDDLEAWLAESFMMKRAFKGCAIIAGLIERRFPGEQQKTGPPDHLLHRPDLRRAAPPPAGPPAAALRARRCGDRPASTWRGWAQMLARIKGRIRHAPLEHLSPFSVPILLEIGKERSPGQAGEHDPGGGRGRPDRRGPAVSAARRQPSPTTSPTPPAAALRTARRRRRGAAAAAPARCGWRPSAPWWSPTCTWRRARPTPRAARCCRPTTPARPCAGWRPRSRRWRPPWWSCWATPSMTGEAEDRLAADDAERLRALARGRTLVWVVGNHDADGPRALPGEVGRRARARAA